MRKRNSNTTEYTPTPEPRTYQTGSARPRAEHRGLIAILMILVIFLGGIVSALGILNIRLLQALNNERSREESVSVSPGGSGTSTPVQNQDSAPTLPPHQQVDLQLEDAPERDTQGLMDADVQALVTVFCGDREDLAFPGVIVDGQGYILTNAFSIFDKNTIYVRLSCGRQYRATLVGLDACTDLAVLYIDCTDLTAARFASSDCLADGDALACILSDRQIHSGRLDSRIFCNIGDQQLCLLDTDLTAVGPVYNAWGQIVGFISPEYGNCAIPSSTLKEVVEQIIACGTVPGRPTLGVELEEIDPIHQQYWNLPPGLRVTAGTEVNCDSMLQPGDILTAVEGTPISNLASLYRVLRSLQAGQEVSVTLIRDHQEMTLNVTVCNSGT